MRQRDRLRIGLAVQWAAGSGVAAFGLALPAWAVAPAGAALAAMAVTAVLALEFVLAALVDPARPGRRRGFPWRAWLGESVAHLRAFWVLQPFCADFELAPPVNDASRPAVLLIHGFACNRAIWLPLARSGRLSGCNLAALDLEPPCASIESHAGQIDRAVRDLLERGGARRVCIVAHSMGGLAVLAYLARFGDDSLQSAITLATPFSGTRAAHLQVCPAARQMRPGSAWLTGLAGAITPQVRDKFVCVAARDDNIVVPRNSALLRGARQHQVDGVGHLALASDPALWQLILDHAARVGSEPAERTPIS